MLRLLMLVGGKIQKIDVEDEEDSLACPEPVGSKAHASPSS